MLGGDLVLPGSLVRDSRLDYVALGHIHKPQNLNENAHPPVIYPGSIQRVDFGEARDEKFFVTANVAHGKTHVEWRKLDSIRPFIDRYVRLDDKDDIMPRLCGALPSPDQLNGAIVRLVIEYPRDWETMIDDAALREQAGQCFEFHLIKRPQMDARIRLPEDHTVGSLTPLELLDLYWRASHTDQDERQSLGKLAGDVIREVHDQDGIG